MKTRRRIGVIGVPSSAGARNPGQEQAPAAFRAAGLLDCLRDEGIDVTDLGDLAEVRYSPDPENPRQQNLGRVVSVCRQVAAKIEEAVASDLLPLVLGGDCSLSLGVIAGLIRHQPRLGLLYFDGDVDLNTPATTPSGIIDGMVIAHVLGNGAPELARIGPRCPLLAEDDVVLFGYDEASDWLDPVERELLQRSRMPRFSADRVREDVSGAAREAMVHLEDRSDAILVHFDVDATNLSCADVPRSAGLDPEVAFAALGTFVSSASCAGIVVAEFNAERDRDGTETRLMVDGLVGALAAPPG